MTESWFPAMVIPGAHMLGVAKLLRQLWPIKVEKVVALLFSRHTQVVHDCDDHYKSCQLRECYVVHATYSTLTCHITVSSLTSVSEKLLATLLHR